jgi:hypothetical protein
MVYQVCNPVTERGGDQQSRHWLFRYISAYITLCVGSLSIESGCGFTGLICCIASHVLDYLASLRGEPGGSSGNVLGHGTCLFERVLHTCLGAGGEVAGAIVDLSCRVNHGTFDPFVVH